MKKIISTISGALFLFAISLPLTTIAKSAEFFSIGTGGPTGVYFQVGNAPTPPEPSPNGGQSETGESTPTVPNSPDSSIAPDDVSNVGQFTDI